MGRPKILLVDDEPLVLLALSTELEEIAEVRAVGNVSDALALVDKHHFDIVVADLRLPDRWGDELLAHVAARSPSTHRLLLTADSDPRRTVRELLEKGIVEACFQKPMTGGLLGMIRKIARS